MIPYLKKIALSSNDRSFKRRWLEILAALELEGIEVPAGKWGTKKLQMLLPSVWWMYQIGDFEKIKLLMKLGASTSSKELGLRLQPRWRLLRSFQDLVDTS